MCRLFFFDRVPEQDNCISVLIDNKKAAYEATKHLIEEGCKKIIHITASVKKHVYMERLKGYKQALKEFNIKFKEEYIISGNLSMEAGKQAAEKILKLKPLPDAVFVANDTCAVTCMLALQQAGLNIPADIGVCWF